MAQDYSEERLFPCYLLQDRKIPCVVWFEDAIAEYGVSTIVFNLHILVKDIDEAARVLIENGWSLVERDPAAFDDGTAQKANRRLVPPKAIQMPDINTTESRPPPPRQKPAGPENTVLLQAEDWNYTLPETIKEPLSATTFYPPLPALLDALIESYLDAAPDNERLWSRLAVQVEYLYEYTPALKECSFAAELKQEHRQFHFDHLSGMSTGTLPFARHEFEIREKLRQGNYELQECSASRDNEDLFQQERQKRLLAAMLAAAPP